MRARSFRLLCWRVRNAKENPFLLVTNNSYSYTNAERACLYSRSNASSVQRRRDTTTTTTTISVVSRAVKGTGCQHRMYEYVIVCVWVAVDTQQTHSQRIHRHKTQLRLHALSIYIKAARVFSQIVRALCECVN